MATSVLQRLKLIFEADTKGAKKDLKRFEKSMGDLRSSVLNLAGGLGFGALTKSLFDTALAVEETASKFNTVFGDMAGDVQGLLDNMGAVSGVSEQMGQDILATTGAIVQGFGFSQEASAKLSKEAFKLAADFASFNNIPIAETAMAVQAAFTGEREQLKRLGIVIRQVDVDQRALAISMEVGSRRVTDQHKALATLELITEKAGVQIGDLARTQDTAAAKTRVLTAEFENIKATIAAALLPAFNFVLNAVARIVGEIEIWAASMAATTAEVQLLLAMMKFWDKEGIAVARESLRLMNEEVERTKRVVREGITPAIIEMAETLRDVAAPATLTLAERLADLVAGGAGWEEKSKELAKVLADQYVPAVTMADAASLTLTNDLDGQAEAALRAAEAQQRLNQALDKFSSLGAKLGKIGGLLGQIGIGVGGLGFASGLLGKIGGFAGFFAHGGSIPAGQTGVVGERGPELVTGPATVTPGGGDVTVHLTLVTESSRKLIDTVTIKQKRDADMRRVVRVPISAVATG